MESIYIICCNAK